MDISKIKLIIWDLDETFWNGILSDGTAEVIQDNIQLIKNLTDCGVINSICSKNDFEQVKSFLSECELWDHFVFNSINWSQKGKRVKEIISEMNLRDVNVLFIDDNHLNLQEAKQECPNIMIAYPDVIPELVEHFKNATKKDVKHSRLNQYKVLETKKEFRASSGSDEEFLFNCNIQVEIKHDCLGNIERISDLIMRSNQLNFTKIRSTEEELIAICNDTSIETGYVVVSDKFGEYGIVGFFAIKDNKCIHFVFSCRTLNMGVEQYVYNLLNRPEIAIVGEVASSLEGTAPLWINHSEKTTETGRTTIDNVKTLIKGPCDLELVFSFIEESKNIIKEFVYVGRNGVSIESGGHTHHIIQHLTLDEQTKNKLINELPFGDKNMFQTSMFNQDIGVVYLSMFTDPNLGLYKEKKSGAIVAFGEWTNDLTDKTVWNDFVEQKIFTANCKFTIESLEFIKENYDFIGRISPEETVKNLDFIHSHIAPSAKLILNLGSEIEYVNNSQEAYSNRHIYHKTVNDLIKEWAREKRNVYLIEVTNYINSQDDYTNNINHFAKSVYHKIAQRIIEIINTDDLKIRKRQKSALLRKVKKLFSRIMGL